MSQLWKTIEPFRAPESSGERVGESPEEIRKISKKLIFGLKNMIFMIFLLFLMFCTGFAMHYAPRGRLYRGRRGR